MRVFSGWAPRPRFAHFRALAVRHFAPVGTRAGSQEGRDDGRDHCPFQVQTSRKRCRCFLFGGDEGVKRTCNLQLVCPGARLALDQDPAAEMTTRWREL